MIGIQRSIIESVPGDFQSQIRSKKGRAMPGSTTPTTRTIVIERSPWFSSGLRREWSDLPHTILFRDRFHPQDFPPHDRPLLALIDLDSLPSEGLRGLEQLTRSVRPLAESIMVILNSNQRHRAAELLSLGVICYFVKPVSVFEVARGCRKVLKSRDSAMSPTMD